VKYLPHEKAKPQVSEMDKGRRNRKARCFHFHFVLSDYLALKGLIVIFYGLGWVLNVEDKTITKIKSCKLSVSIKSVNVNYLNSK